MPLSKDLREFVGLLNSNGVEYLVVGGFAVSYHGFARYTGDTKIAYLRPFLRAVQNAHNMNDVPRDFVDNNVRQS